MQVARRAKFVAVLSMGILIALGSAMAGCRRDWSSASPVQPSPQPPNQPPAGVDTAIKANIDQVLANPGNPDPALLNFAAEVANRFVPAADPGAIYELLKRSALASVDTPADLDAVRTMALAGGNVFAIDGPAQGVAAVGVGCPPTSAVVYYVNGILTTQTDAIGSANALRAYFLAAYPERADSTTFRWFYNRSGLDTGSITTSACNLLQDSLEWFLQSGCASSSLSPLQGLFCQAIPPDLLAEWFRVRDLCIAVGGPTVDLLQSAAQWLDALVANLTLSPLAIQQTVELAALLTQDVLSGRSVVIACHSQGNFFVRAALDLLPLDVRSAIGVVSVASPTPFTAASTYGSFSYHMLAHDAILCTLTAPAPNRSNPLSETAGAGLCVGGCCVQGVAVHAFVESYLAYAQSRQPIVDDIAGALSTLKSQGPALGQGYFQATLTWNIPGDIDLHVFEPDNAHVYWANQVGTVGELDRDDITGTGPENYFVCRRSNLLPGNYTVRVNNYGGATGTLATITIRAGTELRQYSRTMDAANGGQNLLFVTNVEYLGDGTFIFNP